MHKSVVHTTWFMLTCIVVLGFFLRLYKVSNPILDWHAFRQADTAAVTRYYVQNGIDLLHPKFDDVANIASGMPNPDRHRMVEFPLVNAVIAQLIIWIPSLDIVLTSRLFSIGASVLSILLLYGIVSDVSGKKVGLWAAFALAVLPFNVYYSRVILPEPFLVTGVLLSLFAWGKYLQSSNWRYLLLSVVAMAFALGMKPFAVFFYPVILAMAWVHWRFSFWKKWAFWVLLTLPFTPLLWWRNWITQYPEGIPANAWLFNSNNIRLKPSWFRWLIYERLIRLMLGYVGVIALISSTFRLSSKEKWIYGSWWFGMILYLIVIATGNVQHDYYQAMLAPILAISLAKGFSNLYVLLTTKTSRVELFFLLGGSLVTIVFGASMLNGIQASAFYPERLAQEWVATTIVFVIAIFVILVARYRAFSRPLALTIVVGLSFLAWALSASYVKEYYQVNNWEYLHTGAAVQALLPVDARVIAPANGDTMFLYQINRPGWALGFEIDDKIAQGATHYISTNMDDETTQLASRFVTLQQTEMYIVLDLKQPLLASNSGESATTSESER